MRLRAAVFSMTTAVNSGRRWHPLFFMQVFVAPKDTDAIGNKSRGLKRFQVVINYMEITIDTECNHISEFKEFL
jgi:hypothetical protein